MKRSWTFACLTIESIDTSKIDKKWIETELLYSFIYICISMCWNILLSDSLCLILLFIDIYSYLPIFCHHAVLHTKSKITKINYSTYLNFFTIAFIEESLLCDLKCAFLIQWRLNTPREEGFFRKISMGKDSLCEIEMRPRFLRVQLKDSVGGRCHLRAFSLSLRSNDGVWRVASFSIAPSLPPPSFLQPLRNYNCFTR